MLGVECLGFERLTVLLVDQNRVIESPKRRSESKIDKDNHSKHDFPFTDYGKAGSVLPADCHQFQSCFGSD
jgi:hypothetical protein